MVHCAVVGCSSRSQTKEKKLKSNEKDLSFFKIPKVRLNECDRTKMLSEKRCREWLARISRKSISAAPDKYRVCSRHFLSGKPSTLFDECNPDWAPSLHLGYATKASPHSDRFDRLKARRMKRKQATATVKAAQEREETHVDTGSRAKADADVDTDNEQTALENGMHCQTDLTTTHIQQLEDEVKNLREELRVAKEDLAAKQFTEEALHGDDERVTFYTGLPSFMALLFLFNLLKDHAAHSARNVLTQFEEMVMFMMRMRLGTQMQDLAYRFGVSQPTVSRICDKWLDVCYDRLGSFVRWPEKEEIMETMPAAFVENFGLNVRVILDCFEIFIDRPSSLMPRAETWSQYKHHNTVKFLLGISPQGMVTFISQAFGGRASDKLITEDSGVLILLDRGDIVLADRGFLIAESVGMCCAKLAIPSFTKGKRQLSSSEVEQTREIANVRIHVERVIGMVKNKYTILKGSLPVEVLRKNTSGECVIDKIARVCCALTNLCNSVVPFD